jgi:RNA polymerase sigma-70 factor, ECF subfamily
LYFTLTRIETALLAVVKSERGTAVQDERDLILRAQAYEPAAFAEIYERFYQGIFNYTFYRLGDEPLAEDITAEVFVKALEAIDTYTFRGIPFSAWLYRIANNMVTDHFRRKPRHNHLPLEETQIATDDNPNDMMERGFTQRELQNALNLLTDEQQQVIILKFVDGMSNIEVAQVLGKTEGAIKSLQHRALASLGRVLEDFAHDY